MNKCRIVSLAVAAALASPLVLSGADRKDAASEPATTRPANALAAPAAPVPTNVPPLPQAPRRRFMDMPPPTPEQIRDAEAFAEKNSPFRYHAYKRFMENGPPEFRERMRFSIVRAFVEMQIVEREDPDLYQMKLSEMKLDDQIWGAVAEFRRGGEAGNAVSRADLRDQIRPQFKELLEVRRKQAEHRIERMQVAIRDEQVKLEKLKRINDDSLNTRLEQEIEYGGLFRTGFGPGPGGGGPGSNPGRFRNDANPTPATNNR